MTELAELQVHRARRAAGIPTLTTLVGPREEVLSQAGCLGLADVVCEEPALPVLAEAWVTGLLSRTTATQWLASCLSRPEEALAPALEAELVRKTPVELPLFLERWLRGLGGEALQAAYLVLSEDGLHRALEGLGDREALSFLRGVRELSGPSLPSVLMPTARAAPVLAELAQAIPSAVLTLALEPAEAEALLNGPPTRVRSLVASGVVHLLPTSELHPKGTAALRDEPDDAARSAAEAFLAESLESLPETHGLFQLNAQLEVAGLDGSPRTLEVDLLAPALRLAIEIDGFHHFQDPAAYRRDRHKDLLLQRAGFQVLRVLAEDVVSRLEEILRTVRRLVRERSSEEVER